MKKVKLKSSELVAEVTGKATQFPKYTSQIINLANQNAQGTRPKVVGQMTELFQKFGGRNFEDWKNWYNQRKPESIENATDKIYEMVKNIAEATKLIDKQMVREWVQDLVLAKTFVGLCHQEPILKKIAEIKGTSYRFSNPSEESKGIDGYIGDTPVSIKPSTYTSKNMLSESIDVAIILYEKKKDGISFTYDF